MIQFDSLRKLLDMDFRQLRAESGGRATDKALSEFLNLWHSFFAQIERGNQPTNAERQEFDNLFKDLLCAINVAEVSYFIIKYDEEYSDCAFEMRQSMAKQAGTIANINGLVSRMQYWAATEVFGDAIRNPEKHRLVVKKLLQWGKNDERNISEGLTGCDKLVHKPAEENNKVTQNSKFGIFNQKNTVGRAEITEVEPESPKNKRQKY